MELRGNAKEAFNDYCEQNLDKNLYTLSREFGESEYTTWDIFEELPIQMQYSFIIEWLDSVCIYVSVEPSIPIGWENPDCFIFRVCTDTNRLKFPNRQQATEKAIEKAIEIYNEKHK